MAKPAKKLVLQFPKVIIRVSLQEKPPALNFRPQQRADGGAEHTRT